MTLRAIARPAWVKRLCKRGIRLIGHVPLQNSSIYKISDEVREAVHNGGAVVALETTIYTHGSRNKAKETAWCSLNCPQAFRIQKT